MPRRWLPRPTGDAVPLVTLRRLATLLVTARSG
jgi:hypothetical protein